MAIKLKIPSARSSGRSGNGRGSSRSMSRGRGRFLSHDPIVRIALLSFLSAAILVVAFFAYWYVKYDRIIEQRFRSPVFASSAKIFAAPQAGEGRIKADHLGNCGRVAACRVQREGRRISAGQLSLRMGARLKFFLGRSRITVRKPATITVADGAVVGDQQPRLRRTGGIRTRAPDADFAVRRRAALEAAAGEVRRYPQG